MSLRRPEGNASANLRVIHAIGRFDGIPDTQVIELTERGYQARGSEKALGVHRAREALIDMLPKGEETALTLEEIVDRSGLGRSSLQEALNVLQGESVVGRAGKGAKGSPYAFYLL